MTRREIKPTGRRRCYLPDYDLSLYPSPKERETHPSLWEGLPVRRQAGDGLCYNIFMKKRRGIFRTKHRVKTKRGKKAKLVYAKRNPDGTFADIQSIKRANAHERLHHSKKKVKSGYGWRGDTK